MRKGLQLRLNATQSETEYDSCLQIACHSSAGDFMHVHVMQNVCFQSATQFSSGETLVVLGRFRHGRYANVQMKYHLAFSEPFIILVCMFRIVWIAINNRYIVSDHYDTNMADGLENLVPMSGSDTDASSVLYDPHYCAACILYKKPSNLLNLIFVILH